MTIRRYAIYHVPEKDALAGFGADWLGWDAAAGEYLDPPDIPDLPMPWDEITRSPRKYGFHATLKPPFRLAGSHTEADLLSAFDRFCSTHQAVALDGFELAQLGRFLALVPVGDTVAASHLAAEIVRSFDAFRAALTPDEMARRRGAGLGPEREALLRRWGYPYVMDAFRFHLTLTGKLPKAKAHALRTVLSPHLAPFLSTPYTLGSLCLMGEGADGMFRVIRRRALSG